VVLHGYLRQQDEGPPPLPQGTGHGHQLTIQARRLLYREAGPRGAPDVVLLHGFPASSFMFRDLIPLLADRCHLIAPDHVGFGPVREYWAGQNPQTEAPLRQALTLEAIRWQYLHGVPDPSLVSPDTWCHDFALVSRPGNDLALYPKLHAYLRDSRVPLLAVWGRNDQIFVPEGALAFADDAPAAEIHLLDGGLTDEASIAALGRRAG
jgi:pimeloyl-ACP methyl ester carboxylesterase